MATNAYTKFIKTIRRCESLVASYQELHRQSQTDQNIPAPKDIVRGAVVLSVAALDAYVTDVFSEKLVPYLRRYTPDQSLIDLLSKAGLDTKEALKLLSMDRPYRRIRTLINTHYQRYTTQKFDVIDEIFLPYRLSNITTNAERMSGRTRLKNSVGKLVERRHEIAHNGDYNSHGRIKDINEDQISRRINNLELLVTNMDTIICNRIN